jgi:hypothetical protein
MYRCVKANESSEVIAIGVDEDQANQDYHGIGTWQDFTFSTIPQPEGALLTYINENDYQGSILKVVDSEVVLKTVEELV